MEVCLAAAAAADAAAEAVAVAMAVGRIRIVGRTGSSLRSLSRLHLTERGGTQSCQHTDRGGRHTQRQGQQPLTVAVPRAFTTVITGPIFGVVRCTDAFVAAQAATTGEVAAVRLPCGLHTAHEQLQQQNRRSWAQAVP